MLVLCSPGPKLWTNQKPAFRSCDHSPPIREQHLPPGPSRKLYVFVCSINIFTEHYIKSYKSIQRKIFQLSSCCLHAIQSEAQVSFLSTNQNRAWDSSSFITNVTSCASLTSLLSSQLEPDFDNFLSSIMVSCSFTFLFP